MTIAAGFYCQDGIVFFADSQESLDGYKYPIEKIYTHPRNPDFPIMITGAGFGPAIDVAAERLIERLEGGNTSESIIKTAN
jgi:hypothetical protein